MDDDERLQLALGAIEGVRGTDALEAVVTEHNRALTRFTHNTIHQNLDERGVNIAFRAIVDGRMGSASCNDRAPAALASARERAIEQARIAPRTAFTHHLPGPSTFAPVRGAHDDATANATPQWRADAAAQVFDRASAARSWAAGYIETARVGTAIANTNGLHAAHTMTSAAINVKCVAPDASGYAEAYARALDRIDPLEIATRAADKARSAGTPSSVDAGTWTVVFEPAAAGELLHYLVPHFSAQMVDEGASFLSDGLDRRCAGDNVTIVDDYAHPLHAGRPFDIEGTPTQRAIAIEHGIGRAFVTDTEWAARLHVPNTGHNCNEIPFSNGPQSRYPVLLPGTRPPHELIGSIDRGVLVSRCWYIRYVDRKRTIVTGMTRDGTFLIENGAMTRGLRNFRFNVNILDLLAACEIGNDSTATGGYAYRIVVPTIKFDAFEFTSVTDF